MSAFIVGRETIDALVTLAFEGPSEVPVSPDTAWYPPSYESRDSFGQKLLTANVESVKYRYPDEAIGALPGPTNAYYAFPYRYAPYRRLTPVEGLALLDGYEYQSCERPDWFGSVAHRMVDSLRGNLISRLPGYNEAEWTL